MAQNSRYSSACRFFLMAVLNGTSYAMTITMTTYRTATCTEPTGMDTLMSTADIENCEIIEDDYKSICNGFKVGECYEFSSDANCLDGAMNLEDDFVELFGKNPVSFIIDGCDDEDESFMNWFAQLDDISKGLLVAACATFGVAVFLLIRLCCKSGRCDRVKRYPEQESESELYRYDPNTLQHQPTAYLRPPQRAQPVELENEMIPIVATAVSLHHSDHQEVDTALEKQKPMKNNRRVNRSQEPTNSTISFKSRHHSGVEGSKSANPARSTKPRHHLDHSGEPRSKVDAPSKVVNVGAQNRMNKTPKPTTIPIPIPAVGDKILAQNGGDGIVGKVVKSNKYYKTIVIKFDDDTKQRISWPDPGYKSMASLVPTHVGKRRVSYD